MLFEEFQKFFKTLLRIRVYILQCSFVLMPDKFDKKNTEVCPDHFQVSFLSVCILLKNRSHCGKNLLKSPGFKLIRVHTTRITQHVARYPFIYIKEIRLEAYQVSCTFRFENDL